MDFAASPFDIKTLGDTGAIEGLLAGFGSVDHGADRLLPGCLGKSLADRTVPLPMLLHHKMDRPIGAWKEWTEHADGLFVRGNITLSTRDGAEAHALAKDGALTGLSIGWQPLKHSIDAKGVRNITEAAIYEGSLVAIPMNDKTRIASVKTIDGARDIEEILNASGLSSRRAKAAASAAWKAINESTDETQADAELAALISNATARLAKGGR